MTRPEFARFVVSETETASPLQEPTYWKQMVGLGGLEPPTSPLSGALWCYMHSSVAMITLLTASLMVTSWHDC